MTPRSNSSIDERSRNLGVLVHLPDERPHLGVSELADAIPEDGFVFRQDGQGLDGIERLFCHRRLSHGSWFGRPRA